MSYYLQKIRPEDYIHDTDPVPAELLDVSSWYETETFDLTVTTFPAGDASENVLAWKLAQGWKISVEGSEVVTGTGASTVKKRTYTLVRRRLNTDKACKALIEQATEAYNEGRENNDQRYDDIIDLYTRLLDKVEDNLQEQENFEGTAFDTIKDLADALPDDFEDFEANPDIDLDTYGTAQRARINLQYDNLVAGAKQSLINRGLYSTNVYDSVVAGLANQRAISLNDFEDKLMRLKAELAQNVYNQKISMRQGVMNAYERLKNLLQNGKLDRVKLQVSITNELMNFMERRTDGYPDMNSIAQMAAQFGSANSTEVTP